MTDKLSVRTLGDMRPVLMSADVSAPDIFYYMLRGGVTLGNVTTLEPGQAGREYIKTLGHYHPYDFSETYRVLEGEALMLLQKRKMGADNLPIDDEIEEFKVIRLSAGDSLTLPLHFGHVLVNIGSTFLITRDDSPSDPASVALHPHADYEPIRKLGGAAFYCVNDNGLPALIKNPHYKHVSATDLAGLAVIEQ